MAPIVGTAVRVSAIAENFNGETVVTTWDFAVTTVGSGGVAGFSDDMLEMINDMYDNISTYISATVTPLRLEFYERNGVDYLPPIDWTGMTFTATGEEMPANSSAYLVVPTALRGVRGRKFVFNTVEANNAGGVLTAGYKTALLALGSDWLAGGPFTNGWLFVGVVWSSVHNTALIPLDITVGDQWGTTTRRKQGN